MKDYLQNRKRFIPLCVMLAILTFQTMAADYTVSSADQFNSLSLSAGDVVTWTDGTYSSDDKISFTANGTASNPITLQAETPGGVVFTGEMTMDISGDYVVIDGFYWNGGAGTNNHVQFRKGSVYANNSTIRNCAFNNLTPSGTDKHRWIVFYGTNNVVENCSFLNKNSPGALLLVELEYNDFNPVGHQIRNNYFYNFVKRDPTETHSGDSETIRVGTSEFQDKSASTTVEGNYFYKSDGENEIITNKSADNNYFNNTFRRCRGSLVMRHGARATVQGNYFLGENTEGTGGIRITDSYHVITNNYFQDLISTGDKWNNGITLVGGSDTSGGITNGYQKVDDIVVADNTLYNVESPIFYNDRSSYDPTGILENNVIYTTLSDVVGGDISGTGQGMTYDGNIYSGSSLGISDGGFTNADPGFSANGEIFKVSNSGPAAGKGSAIFEPHTDNMVGTSVGACFLDASGNSLSECGGTPSNNLSVSSISNFSNTGGSASANVSANVTWTASDNQSWISISPSSGSGNGSITITTSANTSSSSRSGIVTVSGDGVSSRTISVNQDGSTPTGGGTAEVPSDLMENCNQWKITYPTGEEDKTLCDEPNNEFFYVNDTQDAIVFRAPIRSDNGTTPNSDNIRSELREREEDGSLDIYWDTDGTHEIYVKQAITHLPINKSHLVATQIHGVKTDNDATNIDDAMVMRLEDSHLFLSFNGGDLRDDVTIKTNYNLGDIHEVIFKVIDGKHYCYYSEDGNLKTAYNSGNASSYLVYADGNDYVFDRSYEDAYFKVGNYTQSNPEEEGDDTDDPENYGEVLVYDFSVNHGEGEPTEPVAVTGVSFSSSAVSLSLGAVLELSPSVSPSNATDQGVSYNSSNSSVASVNSSGDVTAISEGSATITVTTNDGDFDDTITVTVNAPSTGDNLALNKTISATGTADGDNVVANLVDGDIETRWSVSGFPQTATIDLGAVFSLASTEVVCYSDRDYQYTVSVSTTENGTYTQVVDRTSNTTPGTEDSPIINNFSEVDGRFVKVTVTGAGSYTGDWVSLLEFRIFAGDDEPQDIAVTGVSLSSSSASLEIGETEQLSTSVSPSNATNSDVSYSSSNAAVASVNTNGLVTAVSAGSATITVTTDDGSFTDTSSITVNSVASELPSPWSTSDIGAVATTGSASYSGGTFTVQGSGADIWGTADEFRFVYQTMSGDGEVIAQVNAIANTNVWAKAGVMIRESLDAGSTHAIAVTTPSKGFSFQRRTSTNSSSAHTTIGGIAASQWVKLNREGSTLTASYSADGSSWIEAGSTTIDMSDNVYIGLCVSSHADGTLTTATFDNVSIETTTIVIPESSNVALNKDVTATDEQSTNPASNLVDGDADSRWSGQGYTQSATVDLGAIHTISSTEVICFSDRAYQYVIEASIDGNSYTTIVDRSNNSTGGSNDTPIADAFSNTDARYVRISVSGADSYTGDWISIEELRVFGYESSSARYINPSATTAVVTNLYPNPAADVLNITGAELFNNMVIFDNMGKTVLTKSLNEESNVLIDVNSFKPGLYIFRLTGTQNSLTKRIMVQ